MTNVFKLAEAGAVQVRNYGERLISGIDPKIFASKPSSNGKIVETVHPAFIFGHLNLYPYRISSVMNLGAEELKPPQSYTDLFLKDTVCEHDPDLKVYPPMAELTSFYLQKTDRIIEILKDIDQDKFFAVNIEEKTKDRFPIVGQFVIYLLTAHSNGHFGQLSVWRRCMGLGPA